MDQLEDGRVSYHVDLDPVSAAQEEVTPRQLSEEGACLAHLGIRALSWMLRHGAMKEALDRAAALKRRTMVVSPEAPLLLPAAGDGSTLIN